MFGSVMLDVAVGLALVYALLSLASSTIQEGIVGYLKLRSTFLEQGIRELLKDPSLTTALYEHPLLSALYRGASYADAKKENKLPSYIPSRNFALALLDIVARGRDLKNPADAGAAAPVLGISEIRAQVARIENRPVQRVILTAIDMAQGDVGNVQTHLEAWFDSAMDRVSGWYKRRTQIILFGIGLLLTVVFDVDTLRVAHHFYTDPGARQAAVAMAPAVGTDPKFEYVKAHVDSLSLPIGWPNLCARDGCMTLATLGSFFLHLLTSLPGWLLTALAISLGAPFWFDVLNRIMVIRSTVKPHEKSKEEGSQDRQDPNLPTTNTRPTPLSAPAATGLGPVAPTPIAAASATFRPKEWSSGYATGGIL